jgi:hypothetical protein
MSSLLLLDAFLAGVICTALFFHVRELVLTREVQ